ncbi:MAG: serine/threonine protein kinase [Kofleriaceae bacterium]
MRPQVAQSEHVGPYRVVRAIGAGGSARVDLAVIERAYGFQRHVVLKRPLEHLRADAHVAETLRREAHLGGRLRHPNLVAVLDAGTHDGYIYLALEYVAGSSVRTLMQADASPRVHAIPLAAALSIVVGAARGLHEAHELAGSDGAPLGLVHRDVSPANILVDRDGTVKLSDFGIAKDTRVNTLSGSMRGTVTYMAPEQCRGHAFDRRADVFSLGVILHELISGRRLFWAENDVASLHKVLSAPLPDPRDAKPSLAPELCAIAMRAIARDASQRVASASELADRLEAFAARAGIVLGARAVVPLVASERSPSEALTAQLPAITDEPSLVTVIEGADPDEPVEPTFGPNGAGDDEIATPVRQPTYAEQLAASVTPTRSRLLVGILGACVIGGIAIGAVITTRDSPSSAPATAPVSAPAVPNKPETVVPAKPEAVVPTQRETVEPTTLVDPSSDQAVAPVVTEITPEPSSSGTLRPDKRTNKTTDKRTDKSADKRTDHKHGDKRIDDKRIDDKRIDGTKTDTRIDGNRVERDPTPAPVDAGVPPKVEWNPKMVFPSDKPSK